MRCRVPRAGAGRRPGAAPAPPPWVPKTELGQEGRGGEITTMSEALASGLPLREPPDRRQAPPRSARRGPRREHGPADDRLGPPVQVRGHGRRRQRRRVRRTRSGEGPRGRTDNPPGDRPGEARDRRGPARLRQLGVRLRTLAHASRSRSRAVRARWSSRSSRRPAGVGLAVGDVAKPILRFAGITDAWGYTDGHTKTTVNYAQAAYRRARRPRGAQGCARGCRAPQDRSRPGRHLDPPAQGGGGSPDGRSRPRSRPGRPRRGGPGRGGPGRGPPGRGPPGGGPPPAGPGSSRRPSSSGGG